MSPGGPYRRPQGRRERRAGCWSLNSRMATRRLGGLSAGDRGFQRRSTIPTRVEAEPESPASSGRSLDPATQATMGSLLGSDFSKVKIHSGEAASDSARPLEARAYNDGAHIIHGA